MKNFETNSTEHYAQHGEDLTIAALLQAWTSDKKGRISDLTYLEIGANHPVVLSSTFLLYHRYEMRGVLVEANPELIEALKKARPDDTIVNVAVINEAKDEVTLIVPNFDAMATLVPKHLEAVQEVLQSEGASNQRRIAVKAQRINDILTQHFVDAPPAYMSIDIEGLDLEVLQDMDFERFRPLILQIEHSDNLILDHGQRICAFLQQKNYHLIAKTDLNLIFVTDDFFSSPLLTERGIASTAQYFTKKYQKPRRQPPLKTACNFIKSYLFFPWYVYKSYKNIAKIEDYLQK